MGTERTALGKATFIILNIGFGAIALVCLVGLLGTGLAPFEHYSASMKGLVMLLGLIFFGIIAYVAFLYWNAYRKNNPQAINTVSTVIFVIYLIFFIIFALSSDVVKTMDLDAYLETTQDFDLPGALTGMLTSLIAIGIIMAEVKVHKKGHISPTMRYAWIPVLVMMAYSFGSMIYSGAFSQFSHGMIAIFAISLCMHVGIVLISGWIVNQDKFYAVKSNTTESNQDV